MSRRVSIEPIGPGRYDLGESPVWDERAGRLYWTDALRGIVYRSTPAGLIEASWQFPRSVGSFCLTAAGTILAACESGLVELDPASGDWEEIHSLASELAGTRLNDGKVAPDASFVFGSMDRDERQPLGDVFRYTRERGLEWLAGGFVVFNGPTWSPDGTIFYASDSGAGRLRRCSWAATGPLGEFETIAHADRPLLEGSFDGSTADSEGFVWSSRVFGGRLTRFAPDGRIDREIALPVRKPSSPCFGGDDLSILFVTSMGAQIQPTFPPDGELGGAIFAVRGLGVRGLPMRRFGE
jgi:L-arabinonolactonase